MNNETISQHQDIKQDIKEISLTENDVQSLRGLAFWTKFFAIFQYIGAAITGLFAFIMVIIVVGIIIAPVYIALAVLCVFLGRKLWKASKASQKLSNVETQGEYNQNSLLALDNLKGYFKISGIVTIVSIVLNIIFVLIGIIVLAAGLVNMDQYVVNTDQYVSNDDLVCDSDSGAQIDSKGLVYIEDDNGQVINCEFETMLENASLSSEDPIIIDLNNENEEE